MGKITGAQVLEALQQDPLVICVSEPLRTAVVPLVEGMPEALADLLDQPLTVVSLYQARLAFLNHALQNGLVQRLVGADPDEWIADVVIQNETAWQLASGFAAAQRFMSHVVDGTINLPAALSITEEKYLVTGLLEENAAKYEADILTIGDLIVSQPSLILKFHDL